MVKGLTGPKTKNDCADKTSRNLPEMETKQQHDVVYRLTVIWEAFMYPNLFSLLGVNRTRFSSYGSTSLYLQCAICQPFNWQSKLCTPHGFNIKGLNTHKQHLVGYNCSQKKFLNVTSQTKLIKDKWGVLCEV
jgi:hypothetical protein